jgi:hypothetical protein
MSDPMDEPIQLSPRPPTRSIALAAEYLATVVERDWGLRNGRTALYWHLIHVVVKHARPPAGEVGRSEAEEPT